MKSITFGKCTKHTNIWNIVTLTYYTLVEHYQKYFQVDGLKQQAQVHEMAGAGLILGNVCMMTFEKKMLAYWDKIKPCCSKNNESLNSTENQ